MLFVMIIGFYAEAAKMDPWVTVKPTLLSEFDGCFSGVRQRQSVSEFGPFDVLDIAIADAHFKSKASLQGLLKQDLSLQDLFIRLLAISLEGPQLWTYPEEWAMLVHLPGRQQAAFREVEGAVLRGDYRFALRAVLAGVKKYDALIESLLASSNGSSSQFANLAQPVLSLMFHQGLSKSDAFLEKQLFSLDCIMKKELPKAYLDHFGPDFLLWEAFARLPAFEGKNPSPLMQFNRVSLEGRELPRAIVNCFIWKSMWDHIIQGFRLAKWLEYYSQEFHANDSRIALYLRSGILTDHKAAVQPAWTEEKVEVASARSRLLEMYEMINLCFYGFKLAKPFSLAWEDWFPSRRIAVSPIHFQKQGTLILKPLFVAVSASEPFSSTRLISFLRAWFQFWSQGEAPGLMDLFGSVPPIYEELFVRSYLKLTTDWKQYRYNDSFYISFKFLQLPETYFIGESGLLLSQDEGQAGLFREEAGP